VEALEDEARQCGTAAGDGGQSSDDAENNKTNCREVGHNIYILAHQVHCLHSAQTADLRLRSLNVHCA